jgi:hypothetical protein
VLRESIGGYYYGFVLNWPEELELDGQTVEIQFGYQRSDGRVITATPREFTIQPAAGGRASTRSAPAATQPSPAQPPARPRPAAPADPRAPARPGPG